jgi:hypothetical protein
MKVVIFIVSAFWIVMPVWSQQQAVADPPEVRGHLLPWPRTTPGLDTRHLRTDSGHARRRHHHFAGEGRLKLGLGGEQTESNHRLMYTSAWASPQ